MKNIVDSKLFRASVNILLNNVITLGSYSRMTLKPVVYSLHHMHTMQSRTTDNHCLQIWSDQQFNKHHDWLYPGYSVVARVNEIKISALSILLVNGWSYLCQESFKVKSKWYFWFSFFFLFFFKCTMIRNLMLKVHIPEIYNQCGYTYPFGLQAASVHNMDTKSNKSFNPNRNA